MEEHDRRARCEPQGAGGGNDEERGEEEPRGVEVEDVAVPAKQEEGEPGGGKEDGAAAQGAAGGFERAGSPERRAEAERSEIPHPATSTKRAAALPVSAVSPPCSKKCGTVTLTRRMPRKAQ